MSIENMAIKANELREEGHTTREIGQEMHLSKATIEWLLAKQASSNFSEQLPPDVKVGWRSIGVSGSRINSIAEIMADIILEEQEKREFDFDMIAGITNNGIPLATVISDLLGADFGMIRPSREGTQTNYASNYASLKNKNVVIVDDVISTGSTTKEAINFVREKEGNPVMIIVLINKKPDNELEKVPLRALIRARPVRN
jgi:orotate phosphoribosyltransferase